jgi:hypothetical protein
MQGFKPMALSDDAGAVDELEPTLTLDESKGIPLEELQSSHDPSKLEYRTGSPHADYEAYKGIRKAERQHELGQQASTIHAPGGVGGAELAQALAEAPSTTAAAGKEAEGSGDTAMDKYFRKKHGSAPYTDAAYNKDEGT